MTLLGGAKLVRFLAKLVGAKIISLMISLGWKRIKGMFLLKILLHSQP
jgi:hypothetical protein